MNEFNVKIKIVDKLPEGDCGYCTRRTYSNRSYEIAISQSAHKTVADFGSTLLHELLHLWICILQVYGYKVSLKVEHLWITAVENIIIKFMYILKQGEKDKIKRSNQYEKY
jgi:hypothetical protein